MKDSVVIKGLNNGIVVVLNPELEYEKIKEDIAEKFRDSAKFLGKARMALKFSGRTLSDEEKQELLEIICENSDLQIACLLDENPELDSKFKEKLSEKTESVNEELLSDSTGVFHKGSVRSGSEIVFETSVIIMGDINAGATVRSKGNVIVLGSVRGIVHAGIDGNKSSFVFALDLKPVQIKIAETIARAPDEQDKSNEKEPRIAFVENENIYIEPLTKKILHDIYL